MPSQATEDKLMQLEGLLESYGRVAIGFSGGVDSTFLAAVCQAVMPNDTLLVHLTTPFIGTPEQASFKSAVKGAGMRAERHVFYDKGGAAHLDLEALELKISQLRSADVVKNDPDRCYHCKKLGFARIVEEARKRGFDTVIDGSNASDAGDYRPGMRAVEELGVKSPLMEVGFTKDEEREYLREWGFDVWNMPSGACLATRIPTGEPLTRKKLDLVRAIEDELHKLGLVQVRARLMGGRLNIEASPSDLATLRTLGGTEAEDGTVELPANLQRKLDLLGAHDLDPIARPYGKGNMNAPENRA